jgi:hypothetical protein
MRNMHRVGFVGWFLLDIAFSSGFSSLKDRYGAGGHPLWLAWFGFACLAILFVLLITVSVFYVRGENRLRDFYWSVERAPISLANFYWPHVVFAFLAGPLAGMTAGVLSSSLPDRLIIPCFSPFFILVALMFSSVILYLYEEMRVAQAAYLDFAKQLGVDDGALKAVKDRLRRAEDRDADIWAQTYVIHGGHRIRFTGEYTRRIPSFVLSLETATRTPYSCSQLAGQMHAETRALFTQIQNKAKKVDLWCVKGRTFLSVPLLSRHITADLLRDALDVLIDTAREVEH